MEKAKKRIRKTLLSGIFITGLLLGNMNVMAAETGTIKVTLQELQSSDSSRDKIPVALYQVGIVGEDGNPTIDANYGIADYPQNAEAVSATAEKIAAFIKEEPVDEKNTDANGYVEFGNVGPGVYLVLFQMDNAYGKVSPILLNLPYYQKVDGKMEGPVYTVEISPKASANDKTEQGNEPENGNKVPQPESEVKGDKAEHRDRVSLSEGARTADTSAGLYWIVLMILSVSGFGVCTRRKGRA